MHDLTKGAEVTGKIIIDGENVYDSHINPILQRRKIGMVFQKPNPFPTMSIWDNVAAGLKLNGVKDKGILNEIVEDSLKMAYLWDEVKDELKKPAVALSGAGRASEQAGAGCQRLQLTGRRGRRCGGL